MGIDIERDPIPVVPAAHYFCGGVLTNLMGQSSLDRLYAVGETSCTGVHGANRLASTSLLEGVTWGFFAASSIQQMLKGDATAVESSASRARKRPGSVDAAALRRALSSRPSGVGTIDGSILGTFPDWRQPGSEDLEDPALILQDWTTIRNTMWNYVGIVRTSARLERAAADFRDLKGRLETFYHRTRISHEIVELFHGVAAAVLITNSALRNPESRGCHFRKD